MALPSDTMRRAVVGPDGRSWILELQDTGFHRLVGHLFIGLFLQAIGRRPVWRATLLDGSGTEVAEFEHRDPAVARAWVRSVADRIEAGRPPID